MKKSFWLKLLLALLVVAGVVLLVVMNRNSTDLEGALRLVRPNLAQNNQNQNRVPAADYTLEQCIEYKALWDEGNWTERIGSMDKPYGCGFLYPELWTFGVTIDQCREIGEALREGNFTPRFGRAGEEAMRNCQNAGLDFWHMSNESCEFYRAATIIDPDYILPWRRAEMCQRFYPEGWNFPTKARCRELSEMWDEGDATDRMGWPVNQSIQACALKGWDFRQNI